MRAAVADDDGFDVLSVEQLPIVDVPGFNAEVVGHFLEEGLVVVRNGEQPEALLVVEEIGDVAELGDGARSDHPDPDLPAHRLPPHTSTGLPVRALSTTASMARMVATPFSPGSSTGRPVRILSAKNSASSRHWCTASMRTVSSWWPPMR
jgi:hypothetical protein